MLALVPAPASAQLQIKTEDITIKFGFQGQFWADYTQDATAPSAGNQGYAQNFYLLRDRLMFGGTIGTTGATVPYTSFNGYVRRHHRQQHQLLLPD